jgi:hypothetical protein
MEEDIRRTQQQSVPPQVPQVGRAGGETGASPSIRRPMLAASVVEAKKISRGILQWLAPSLYVSCLLVESVEKMQMPLAALGSGRQLAMMPMLARHLREARRRSSPNNADTAITTLW